MGPAANMAPRATMPMVVPAMAHTRMLPLI
jgi:hypothetical protein